jgi:hypothetical protein
LSTTFTSLWKYYLQKTTCFPQSHCYITSTVKWNVSILYLTPTTTYTLKWGWGRWYTKTRAQGAISFTWVILGNWFFQYQHMWNGCPYCGLTLLLGAMILCETWFCTMKGNFFVRLSMNFSGSAGLKKIFEWPHHIFVHICDYIYISSLKRTWPFIWTNLNLLHPRMICIKFDWNWPAWF